MYAPDLSQYSFNGMLGMGDKEHNRKLREVREKQRPERKISGEMDLWNIWKMYK
jgi:type IV secretion system protein VirD4